MPGIRQLLADKDKGTPVVIGEVIETKTTGQVTVQVGNKTYRGQKEENENYYEGDRVVMAVTNEGNYIVGRDNLKPKERKTIIVEG